MFARASLARLWLIQLFVALIAATVIVRVLSSCWFPVIASAINHLPEQGAILAGQLNWPADSPQSLAETRFLAITVDLDHTGQVRSPSQIQAEFGKTNLRVYSVFGCAEIPYWKGYRVSFNIQELKPWWGAWEPPILAAGTLSIIAGLFLSWALLATLYSLPAWLMALYLNRELTIPGSWRLAGAALMPGALFLSAAIAFYGLGRLDLVQLAAAFAFHLLLGWVYLVLGVVAAPKLEADQSLKKNPFTPQTDQPQLTPDEELKKSEPNPFRGSGQ